MTTDLKRLAADRRAVIMAHYYCRPEIHELADFVGDSLALAQMAAQSPAEVIVLCGVHFMAETASILCPDKKILLANAKAGCPMADMVEAEALRQRKRELPGVPVVTYVNSPAAVKAESDICCTSANVVAVLKSLPDRRVLMTPDKNLAAYAQTKAPDKEVLFWPGFCIVHHALDLEEVRQLRRDHPVAPVLAHPECTPAVLKEATFISSTRGILEYCRQSREREFIILTEEGILHPLKKDNPGKIFHTPATPMICRNMKYNRAEDVRQALETLTPEVKVPEDIRLKAISAVERMLAIPRM
ncbi:MAG: quinolinate synthase NadA [Candidatus Adiutrix sp.]|jgi:quinolinate synthase|nr:quinolinate synthase NadA [Candidatus Adiutrix sp.]